jgi:amidase
MNVSPRRIADRVFIETFARPTKVRADALRIGIKDLIDTAGSITTAGSRAVEALGAIAPVDATCLAGIRTAQTSGRVDIIGRTNLHELAYGGDGINPWFGTPPNPLDPDRVPGGSSSGSASAIGFDRVDAAIGTDTGGSIRIPAACCGVVGLKTTWGSVDTNGVWPLAPSLDTIGPMGTNVDAVCALMDLLVPGFQKTVDATPAAQSILFVAEPGSQQADPKLVDSCRRTLHESGIAFTEGNLNWWDTAVDLGLSALVGEAYRTLSWLVNTHEGLLESRIAARIRLGASMPDHQVTESLSARPRLQQSIAEACRDNQLIATPTLPMLPPLIDDQAPYAPYTAYTRPANLAGTPAIAVPIPLTNCSSSERHLRASLQLMGPLGSEALLVATAQRIEAAVRR